MRAVWLREFGPPSVLSPGEAPEPDGESIEVEFANITFVETQIRAGRGPFPVQLPMIPGNGVGGTCSGDSGGPAFWVDPATGRETNVVMAVNSYGIAPLCNGVDYQQRTDISVTLDFVTPYLQ